MPLPKFSVTSKKFAIFRFVYMMFLSMHTKRNICAISIIHLRCIREVFSDALSSLPISGYFCIISAPTVTPA